MEIVRNDQAPLVPEWVKDTHIGNNLNSQVIKMIMNQ